MYLCMYLYVLYLSSRLVCNNQLLQGYTVLKIIAFDTLLLQIKMKLYLNKEKKKTVNRPYQDQSDSSTMCQLTSPELL